MQFSYRNFKDLSDFEIQRSLFLECTKSLPWAWKPNKSQEKYYRTDNFDPNSKLFAFDREKAIGYESCVKWGTETPIGYPWTLKQYEDEIRHHLFDTVYDYALKNFKPKLLLQRFRKEWKDQANFFEEKGFSKGKTHPIFLLELNSKLDENLFAGYESKILPKITPEILKISRKDRDLENEKDEEILEYFGSNLDLDCIIQLCYNGKPVAISGMASRDDTKYSEIMLFAVNKEYSDASKVLILNTVNELTDRGYDYCSITLAETDPIQDVFKEFNFNLASESVYYQKEP